MPELNIQDLIEAARAAPPPELIEYYVPQRDDCPHCGAHRKDGFNRKTYKSYHAENNMKIKFRKVDGKTVVFLGKKICEDSCLEKQFRKMITEESPVFLALAKQIAIDSGFANGTAFKFLDEYRNEGLLFWDEKKQQVIPADSDLNGGYGAVPINFLMGDGDFTPSEWSDDFLMGVVAGYPNMRLIVEMKKRASENKNNNSNNNASNNEGGNKRMSVTINDNHFDIKYNPAKMSGKWESSTLMLRNGDLTADVASSKIRNTIQADDAAAREEAENYVEAKLRAEANEAAIVYLPNTPEEKAAKELEKNAALKKYGENLSKSHALPYHSAARRKAEMQAKKNVLEALKLISRRRTVKAPNAKAPNAKATNANAQAKNAAFLGLVATHLNGKNKNGILEAEINRVKAKTRNANNIAKNAALAANLDGGARRTYRKY
jgi:hypothetical protein